MSDSDHDGGRIGVVMVNHHADALVSDRATELLASGFAVVVVDNSDTYEGAGVIVRPGANIGFGAACNRGVAALDPAVATVCLHNPDLVASPEAIRALSLALRAQDRPGIVAPAVRSGARLRPAGFRYPSVLRESAIVVTGVLSWWRSRHERSDLDREERPGVAGRRGRRFGSGACLVLDRRAFEEVGGFDENYFLYVEDLDLWDAIERAGFDAEFVPPVVVDHDRGGGGEASNARRELLRWAGVEYFLWKQGGISHRLVRPVHRVALRALRSTDAELAPLLRKLWRRHMPPDDVMVAVRGALTAGGDSPPSHDGLERPL